MGCKSDKRMLFESDSIVLVPNLNIESILIHHELRGIETTKTI